MSAGPTLRQHFERSQLGVDADLEAVLSAATAGEAATVRAALALRPGLPRRSIHVAAALGDAPAALALLDESPSLATARGGQRQWSAALHLLLEPSWARRGVDRHGEGPHRRAPDCARREPER